MTYRSVMAAFDNPNALQRHAPNGSRAPDRTSPGRAPTDCRSPGRGRASRSRLLGVALALLLAGVTLPTGAAATTPAGASATPGTLAAPGTVTAGVVRTGPDRTPVVTADPPTPFTPTVRAQLAATLARLRSADHLPGVQVVIRYPDGSAWMGHAGYRDLAARQYMGNLTLLDAGSITKTFVAALVLQLADQGVLGLDDPIARWLPGLPYDRGITVRELLDHTSGVDDAFGQKALLDALDANHRQAWTPEQVLGYVGKPYFLPGRGWAYSNSNYLLLGQIVELATGQTLASLLRQRFFVPLRLTHTFLQSEEPISGTPAHGYESTSTTAWAVKDLSDGTPYLPFTSLGSSLGAAGALVTTADDLARWALYLYRGKVLPPADLSQMLDFGLTEAFHPRLPYGLGVQRRSLSTQGSWGHNGSLSGFRSAMRYLPGVGVSIAVMTNSDNVDPDMIVEALLKVLYPPPTVTAANRR